MNVNKEIRVHREVVARRNPLTINCQQSQMHGN